MWSTTGLLKFIRWIDANREDEVIDAELLGLLATMVMSRTRIGRDVVEDMRASPYPAFATDDPEAHRRRGRDRGPGGGGGAGRRREVQ